MQAIAAMSINRTIGKNGKLPWPSIKEDFKHFKNITMGKSIIVGRKTFDTLPQLPGRKIHVLTRQWPKLKNTEKDIYYFNLAEFFGKGDFLKVHKNSVVCGGAKIYEEFLPLCNTFYLTTVKKEYEGDTYMPPFEHLFNFSELLYSDDLIDIQKYIKN